MIMNGWPIEWWCQTVFWFDTMFSTEMFSIIFFIVFAILVPIAFIGGQDG